VAIGHAAVEAAVKKGRVKLVIVANDAAQNTKDRFKIMGKKADIPCAYAGDKSTWGQLFGRESAAVFAILEKGFAVAIGGDLGMHRK
jgi:ribosomal protein L7Ae-like RNA K-turn-binding protein